MIMKQLVLLSALSLTLGTAAQAQIDFVDVTINPIGALFGNFSAAAEFPINENIGIEPMVGFVFQNQDLLTDEFKGRGVSAGARGKYYFSPREDNDRFYVNAYARFRRTSFKSGNENFDFDYRNTRMALGLGLGFKVVADNGLIFDVGAGIGRALVDKYKFDDDDFGFGAALGTLGSVDGDFRLSIGYRLQN